MDSTSWLMGVLPLIVFVVVDSFNGMRSGVVAAIIIALAEAAYTIVKFGRIDEITIGSLILVSVFGLISLKKNDPLFFKLQPVLMGIILGSICLVTYLMESPIILTMMQKYKEMIPAGYNFDVNSTFIQRYLTEITYYLGWGFLAHAACVAYSAFYLSKWWWLIFRGLGLYVVMILCAMLARFSL